jgi:hypothetical protein
LIRSLFSVLVVPRNKSIIKLHLMASVHKFSAVKTGRQEEFGAGS